MIFNENDQLNELNLLPIWDVRAPSMLESKLPDCSDNFYIVTTLELNAKKCFLFMIWITMINKAKSLCVVLTNS